MPVLSAQNLRKLYGADVVVADVSLTIHSGERVGLVGINGSGKSTLARILCDLEPADGGEVSRRRGANVVYLAQEPQLDNSSTAREIVAQGMAAWAAARSRYDGISRRIDEAGDSLDVLLEQQAAAMAELERLGGWDQMHRIDAIMGHLGIVDPDAQASTLSGGERRRVALAQLLVASPDLAVLDEPTNHLDVETIEWLEQYLVEEYRGALLLITHDRYLLDRVVDRTVDLDRGALTSYAGGWDKYLAAKAERLELEARTEANRQNLLRRELEWMRRSPPARTTKQKARIQRAEAAIDAVPTARREQVSPLLFESARSGKTILELDDLAVTVGERVLVDGLELHLTRGQRLGVVGPNGAGKTSLLRALLGELEPARGAVRLGKNTRLAYFDQTRTQLDLSKSISENVAPNRDEVEVGGAKLDLRSYLLRFLFPVDKQKLSVGSLSGGERARVALARFLLEPANVLLLDEPTNDLDVQTLDALEAMLLEMEATALIVTHDRFFLDRVATAILAFEGDGRVVRYEGAYQAFREIRNSAADTEKKPKKVRDRSRREPAPRRGLTYSEKRELEGLLELIEEAETEVSALERRLADPELYAKQGEAVPELIARLEAARSQVEQRMARWEELEEKRQEG